MIASFLKEDQDTHKVKYNGFLIGRYKTKCTLSTEIIFFELKWVSCTRSSWQDSTQPAKRCALISFTVCVCKVMLAVWKRGFFLNRIRNVQFDLICQSVCPPLSLCPSVSLFLFQFVSLCLSVCLSLPVLLPPPPPFPVKLGRRPKILSKNCH